MTTVAIERTPTTPAGLTARDSVLLVAVVLALIVGFRQALTAMVQMWDVSPMYSYGYAVPVISAYLLWNRRHIFRALTPKPSYLLGGAFLVLMVVVAVAARAAGVQILEQLAFLIGLVGAGLFLLGARYLQAGWIALAYLLFMIPLWDGLTEPLHAPFQLRSAEIGLYVLQLLGIPAHREGVMISLPGLTLEVARACSGVNYLIAVMALGIPLAYLQLTGFWRRAALLVSAVIVAALSNGLRVALIGVLAHFEIGSPLHGPFHVLHGLFVAGVGYVVLFAGIRVLATGDRARGEGGTGQTETPGAPRRVSMLAVVSVILLLGALSTDLFARSRKEIAINDPDSVLPARLGAWSRGVTIASPPKELAVWSGAHVELWERYRRTDGAAVDLFVAYLAAQDQREELLNYRAGELQARAQSLRISSRRVGVFEASLLNDPSGESSIVFWYEVGCRPSANRYVVKARTLWGVLRHGVSNGALVALVGRGRELNRMPETLAEMASLTEEALGSRLPGCAVGSNGN